MENIAAFLCNRIFIAQELRDRIQMLQSIFM